MDGRIVSHDIHADPAIIPAPAAQDVRKIVPSEVVPFQHIELSGMRKVSWLIMQFIKS